MIFLKYIKDLVNSLVKLDKNLGFFVFVKYVLFIVFIIGLINFRSVLKAGIEIISDLRDEIHNEKLEKRDELLKELTVLLTEFRSSCNADRILFFEYHNSRENLVGIPFKYLDLSLQSCKYGVSQLSEREFQNINSGFIINLFEDIKYGKPVYYAGEEDLDFQLKYPGTCSLFEETGEKQTKRLFLSIPGYKLPLGIIIIEWVDESGIVNLDKIKENSEIFLPRINGLILSKQ